CSMSIAAVGLRIDPLGGHRGWTQDDNKALALLQLRFNGGTERSPPQIVLVVPQCAAALPEAGHVLAAIVVVFVAVTHEDAHLIGHSACSSHQEHVLLMPLSIYQQ